MHKRLVHITYSVVLLSDALHLEMHEGKTKSLKQKRLIWRSFYSQSVRMRCCMKTEIEI